MKVISSISGLRATLDEGKFDKLLIYRYISALCEMYPQGLIVIGRDGRPSGIEIEDTLVKILNYFGRNYIVCGIIPTPTVQVMVEHLGAILGISITASHNPAEWNGLKFINSQGVFFNSNENKLLLEIIEKQKINKIPNEILDTNTPIKHIFSDEAIYVHIQKAFSLNIGENLIDFDAIKRKNFKVVVDAINSSGSIIIPKLLDELNCQVNKINCEANGDFVHQPEPLPENLTELAVKVTEYGADLGIAVDPDADRLVLINDMQTISER
jgi:Phosphomannomutase